LIELAEEFWTLARYLEHSSKRARSTTSPAAPGGKTT
jgi:hypothetical protein